MTTNTGDGNRRTITLEEGVTLELDFSDYDKQREAKYGKQLMQEASLRPEDTPETYQERLLSLYPKPEQQAYIKAMFTLSRAGVFGLYAMQSYAFGEQRVPEVEDLFPEGINQAVIGKGGQEGYTHIPLSMSRERANEVVLASNLASYHIKQAQAGIVSNYKNVLKGVIAGQVKVEGAPIPEQMKLRFAQLQIQIGSQIVGYEALEQVINAEIDRLVTPDYLELFTPKIAQKFTDVAQYITQPFNPIHMFVDTIECGLALDNLDIYVPSATNFDIVYSRVIKKTRPDWHTGEAN